MTACPTNFTTTDHQFMLIVPSASIAQYFHATETPPVNNNYVHWVDVPILVVL